MPGIFANLETKLEADQARNRLTAKATRASWSLLCRIVFAQFQRHWMYKTGYKVALHEFLMNFVESEFAMTGM
ncbi:Hypothetical predicted protein [Olea europaea subsp. europaea]|uniref:Uncharacterized protein n=1 Tax=Olea europaea subsp. europaea TaxID=158383 RepID=A0A8S0SSE9_OLEEU|nr:Hypothetical predicted protein [Olea europaea subsp. europaea]